MQFAALVPLCVLPYLLPKSPSKPTVLCVGRCGRDLDTKSPLTYLPALSHRDVAAFTRDRGAAR